MEKLGTCPKFWFAINGERYDQANYADRVFPLLPYT